jgi:hypothetical protein
MKGKRYEYMEPYLCINKIKEWEFEYGNRWWSIKIIHDVIEKNGDGEPKGTTEN